MTRVCSHCEREEMKCNHEDWSVRDGQGQAVAWIHRGVAVFVDDLPGEPLREVGRGELSVGDEILLGGRFAAVVGRTPKGLLYAMTQDGETHGVPDTVPLLATEVSQLEEIRIFAKARGVVR